MISADGLTFLFINIPLCNVESLNIYCQHFRWLFSEMKCTYLAVLFQVYLPHDSSNWQQTLLCLHYECTSDSVNEIIFRRTSLVQPNLTLYCPREMIPTTWKRYFITSKMIPEVLESSPSRLVFLDLLSLPSLPACPKDQEI